ncbi:ribonuclease H-like domain-containing protein [Thiorhodovibrio winogradskyi]|nr:ribonuclease H-like domain-containing protein [Thiorhodovibrio winogradskyi]
MSLKSRLDRLRQQSAPMSAPSMPVDSHPVAADLLDSNPIAPDQLGLAHDIASQQPQSSGSPANTDRREPGLAERIARLRPRALQPPMRRGDERALADILGAEQLAPGLLRLSQQLDATRPHGRFAPALAAGGASDPLSDLTDLAPGPPETWCFLDTETSGLAGGTGTWVFLFGAARLSSGPGESGPDVTLELEQYLLTRLDAEALMLERIAASLADATLMVSYNGKSFDIPLLVTRCRLAAMGGPPSIRDLGQQLEHLAHLDLLHPVRRAYARCWPDCRLASVESRLLAFDRGQDLPGSEAPAAWLDWLRHGDLTQLPAVVEHNRKDLLSVAALMPALASVYRQPLSHGADSASVAAHWIKRGKMELARALLESSVNGQAAEPEAIRLLAQLHRRDRNWPRAVELWERLARDNQPDALEALAKFHEHIARDPHRALDYASRLPADPASEHRRQRLRTKVKAASESQRLL